MSTEIIPSKFDSMVTYSITDEYIRKLKEEYLPIKVNGITDKAGYAAADKARKEIKKLRVSVQNRREELKKEPLEFGRLIDAKAKAITSQLSEIEEYLAAQQQAVDDEKERIKRDAEMKLSLRVRELQNCNASYDLEAVRNMPDDVFESFLLASQEKHQKALAEQEEKRLALEKLEATLEAERKAAREKEIAQEIENLKLRKQLEEIEAQKKKESEPFPDRSIPALWLKCGDEEIPIKGVSMPEHRSEGSHDLKEEGEEGEEISDDWIERQIKLCDSATPGPWELYEKGKIPRTEDGWPTVSAIGGTASGSTICAPLGGTFPHNDAMLMVAARIGYPAALRALKQARETIYELERKIERNRERVDAAHSYAMHNTRDGEEATRGLVEDYED